MQKDTINIITNLFHQNFINKAYFEEVSNKNGTFSPINTVNL